MIKNREERFVLKNISLITVLLLIGLPGISWAVTDAEKVAELEMKLAKAEKQASIVSAELRTIANQFSLRPNIPKDFSEVSGEYCFFGGWDGHHTHYAIDPTQTNEDIIDFVSAEAMVEAGANLDQLPEYPGILGEMTPGQWYLMKAGTFEPHHGKTPPVALLIRAVDIK